MTAEVVVTGTGLAVAGLTEAADLVDPPSAETDGFDPATALSRRGWKYRDRPARLALPAAEPALRGAGLLADNGYAGPSERTAVVVSSNLVCLDTTCRAVDAIAEQTAAALSPMSLPHTGANMVAGWLAIDYDLRGPNLTICNGATGGLDALHWGRNLIAVGRADVVVVVGVEPDNEVVARFAEGDTRWVDGAAAVVLEDKGLAAKRGARPLAAVAGYARAAGLSQAVRRANPGPVGLWLAAERAARTPAPKGVPMLDLAARLGHCSGALGVMQCLAAVAALDRGVTGSIVATCGGADGDDAAAALVMTGVGGPP